MHDIDAFETKVAAYPAVTVIQKAKTERIEVCCNENFNSKNVGTINRILKKGAPCDTSAFTIKTNTQSNYSNLPTLLEAGVNLGIGVATGKDSVFIVEDGVDIEEDRLLPLAYARDIKGHRFSNAVKRRLINPWDKNGQLIPLTQYPKLEKYFLSNKAELTTRYIAKKNEANWYRTIDKVDVSLTGKKKLLIRDIGSGTEPIYDDGKLYPHHNLYWMTSEVWDLEALGGILISGIVKEMMDQVSVKMRGGAIRNQAQYLKKIRIPKYESLNSEEITDLIAAYRKWDINKASEIAKGIYDRHE